MYENEAAEAAEVGVKRSRIGRDREEQGARLDKRCARLGASLDSIETRIGRLTDTLAAVLLPERPTPGLARSDDDDTSSLGRLLDRFAEQAEALSETLSHLADRVDL